MTSECLRIIHHKILVNMEELSIKPDQFKGEGIAVVTSGGDSQGMNPALRAVVRIGLYAGCRVYYILEGYIGLITGGSNLVEASWCSVSSILHKGGTIIGSARSEEFKTLEGRRKAVSNMVKHGISHLIVIGGDGSLTGANILKSEWSSHVKDLFSKGEITQKEADVCAFLRVVGLVGTIDNDFPGTDMTIGTDSALHRIEEAIFAIASTATSHKRTFIMELMGRDCGFLALRTALTTEADFLFAPEIPTPADWPQKLYDRIQMSTKLGKRLHLVIVSEGAVDHENHPISSESVKKQLSEGFKIDARVTVLGHVQRGGNPSAFDRILGSTSGAHAVFALMDLKPEDEPLVIGIQRGDMVRLKLSECVQQLKAIREGMKNLEFDKVVNIRGRSFANTLNIYKMLNKFETYETIDKSSCRNIAVLQIGTPAAGMNSAIYALTRSVHNEGGKLYGIFGSVEGLVLGNFHEIHTGNVFGLMFEGGSYLGTKRMVPPDELLPQIAQNLGKFNIDGLLIIGGFEAFLTSAKLYWNRDKFAEFCIPIAVIPATTSNNVPGSNFSIGSDTALNSICKACDLFKQTALGTKSRVFIIETMGGRCGYLCSMGALATGADASYIYEEPFGIDDLVNDVRNMYNKMKSSGILRGLVLRNECCNDNYTTDFITKLYSEEGKKMFSTRKSILGHIQDGDIPSSFDRCLAVKLSICSTNWFYEQFQKSKTSDGKICTKTEDSVVVVGLTKEGYTQIPIVKLECDIDLMNRLPLKNSWWNKLRPLGKMLSTYRESN